MLSILFTLFFTYVLTTLFGYLSHYALHQKWAGKAYKAHMIHHWKIYPPKKYSSDIYQSSGKDSTGKIFFLLGIPFLLLPAFLYFSLFSFKLAVLSVVAILALGLVHNYIHASFHVTNHWLNKFETFRKWKFYHFIHHVHNKKNLGIINFTWDHIFSTLIKNK